MRVLLHWNNKGDNSLVNVKVVKVTDARKSACHRETGTASAVSVFTREK